MNLTVEQVAAIKGGKPVTVTAPEVGADCVVVRADVYAQSQKCLFDDSEADPREHYEAALRAGTMKDLRKTRNSTVNEIHFPGSRQSRGDSVQH